MLKIRLNDSFKTNVKKVLRSKPNLRCPKHVRFNPALGRGAIVGGCSGCEKTIAAYAAYLTMQTTVAEYLKLTESYETAKPRMVKKAVA